MPANPTHYKNLLQVFRAGLLMGVIAKQEVNAWADAIIMQEDEPDYFFIELSLCADTNAIIETIGNIYGLKDSTITTRALFGILYHRLNNQAFDINKVLAVLDGLNNRTMLSPVESGEIYQLEEDYDWSIPQLTSPEAFLDNVMLFLGRYKGFTLANYQQWESMDELIGDVLALEEAEWNIVNEQWMAESQWRYRKAIIVSKLKKHLAFVFFCFLAVIPFLLVFAIAVRYQVYISENKLWSTFTTVEIIILISTTRVIINKANRT